ncbi:hypothetical protein ACFY4C_35170 [Actinomadura viridis]
MSTDVAASSTREPEALTRFAATVNLRVDIGDTSSRNEPVASPEEH